MTAFTPQNAATELENLVTDVRGMLASKDLDAVPQIKALRKRIGKDLGWAALVPRQDQKIEL